MNAWSQESYSSYTEGDKETVFYDGFSDNRKGWELGENGGFVRSISDGSLYLESKADMAKVINSKDITIDKTRDFEIETRIKYVSGNSEKPMALLWGKSADNDYGLYFTASGSYRIRKFEGKYVDLKGLTQLGGIKAYQYNKLTIRKIKSNYYIFINEKLIHTMPYKPFYGDKIGFQVPGFTVINVDYISISYLTTGTGASASIPANPPYSWINGRKTVDIYNQQFSSDNGEWGTGESTEAERTIENGHYCMKSKEKYYASWKTIDLDESGNYEIEASIKWVGGAEDTEHAIIWGYGESSSYRFGFTGNQNYTIYKSDNGITDYVDFTKETTINPDEYNKLTIRKLGNNWFFYLNEKLLYKKVAEPFFGKKIGFLVGKKGKIFIDYLVVKQIK
jgi:hypothetical protein